MSDLIANFNAIANSEDGADKISLDEFTFHRDPVTKSITCEVTLNLHYAGTPEKPVFVTIPINEIPATVLTQAKGIAMGLHLHAINVLAQVPNSPE